MTYKVSFVGTNNYRIIEANTMKEAKELFAKAENVQLSSYIKASKQYTFQEANQYVESN